MGDLDGIVAFLKYIKLGGANCLYYKHKRKHNSTRTHTPYLSCLSLLLLPTYIYIQSAKLPITHSFIHPLSLTHPLTHPPTYPPTHPPSRSPIRLSAQSVIYPPGQPLSQNHAHTRTHTPVRRLQPRSSSSRFVRQLRLSGMGPA